MLMRDNKRGKKKQKNIFLRMEARKEALRTIERTETSVCLGDQTHVGLVLINVHDKR